MSLEKLNTWFSIFTNIAVLAGLAALIYELNQNTLAMRDETDVAIYSNGSSISLTIAESKELAEILSRAETKQWAEFSKTDQNRLQGLWLSWIDNAELQFRLLSRKGEAVANIYFPEHHTSWDSFQTLWVESKMLYEPEFVEFFDQIIARNSK